MDKRNIINVLFGLGLLATIGELIRTRRKIKQIDNRLMTTESLAEHANEAAIEAKSTAKIAYDCQLKQEEMHLQERVDEFKKTIQKYKKDNKEENQ